MTTIEILTWVRGPGLVIALSIFLAGSVIRLIEMLMLGRKSDLSVPRESSSAKYGWRLVFTRFLPTLASSSLPAMAFIGGYILHIGFFLIVFFFVPHITVFRELLGFDWPGLPYWVIDAVTLITLIAMMLLLWHRLTDKVKRYLSNFNDYFSWLITLLPILTGYFAFHRLLLPYNDMLVVHIITVEIFLIAFPFTKLMHAFSFVFSRWYTGEAAGRKGVKI